jgi:hypothetical protein
MKPETEKPEASKAAPKEEKKEISETDKLKSELQKKEENV